MDNELQTIVIKTIYWGKETQNHNKTNNSTQYEKNQRDWSKQNITNMSIVISIFKWPEANLTRTGIIWSCDILIFKNFRNIIIKNIVWKSLIFFFLSQGFLPHAMDYSNQLYIQQCLTLIAVVTFFICGSNYN